MTPEKGAHEHDLSQEQVDQVLQTVAKAPPAPPPRIKIYDFKRPDKFSKEQVLTVAIMHETFARQTTTALSSTLRTLVHVHVASVDQLTYEEFIRSIPNPTTIAVVSMEPLKTSAVVEVDPSVAFAMIDRLFGGQGKDCHLSREITDIEVSIMEVLIARMLGNLRDAWATIVDLRPALVQIETNPMFAQIVPPKEMILLVTLEAKIGDAVGMINLCIPYLTIEPLIPKLSAQYLYSSWGRHESHRDFPTASLPVAAEVCFEGERISLTALTGLKKGSRIGIPGYGAGNAFLQAGGARILRLGALRKRGVPRGTYSLAENEVAKDLQALGEARRPAEARTDAFQDALHSLSAEIASTVRSIKGSIQELAKKQEELADQLIFQSPEQEVPAVNRAEKKRPFSFITMAACETLATFLSLEHPQLIALVLSYLDPSLAACVLGRLPPAMQTDMAARICSMAMTAPEVIREVERVLETKLSALSAKDLTLAGGVESIVEILNAAPRAIEKNVVESMEKADPALAEEIKKRMFVFEDITILDRATVSLVLKETPTEDLLLALKAVDPKVRTFISECLPRGEVDSLMGRLESLGRTRLTDVEAAQQRIVGTIRRLEEEGKIVVGREGEMTS